MAKRKQQTGGALPGIKFDAHNFRKHSEQNKQMIHDSLAELGAGRSVVVDKENELIAGNGVYEQAQKLGMPVRVIETDGTELVVVKRTDLATDDEKRKKLAFADNATADNVEWDVPAIKAELDPVTIEAFGVNLPAIDLTDEEEIERKRQEFRERMAAGELDEDDPEYQEFIHKFDAKKTTDDCYTPELVYEAVADFVASEYNLNRKRFVRPFYPGGDYQREKYKKDDVVVDNPPFSILSEIIKFYADKQIKFFLFAPHLTLFSSSSSSSTALPVGVSITYANGATVRTSFLTNLEPRDIRFKSQPRLYSMVNEANDQVLKAQRKELPKYTYDKHVITTSLLHSFSRYGIDFVVRVDESEPVSQLDCQKESGKTIYGKAYLVSDAKKAEREKAEREKAEREKAFVFELSEREKDIISKLK